MSPTSPLETYLRERRALVDAILARHLPSPSGPAPDFQQAVHAAVEGAGKRLRPILVLAVADLLSRPHAEVEHLASAVEFVHSASLALDDLPCMDDATLRRGKPALHVRFGEALTILAAVALLMGSAELLARGLADSRLDKDARAGLMALLGATCGFDGMAAGQWADLSKMGPQAPLATVEFIHRRKTGRLFELCLRGAAILCRANEAQTAALDAYGRNLGLAFQVKDDLLDVECSPEQLGKDAGQDEGKTTFVDIAGVEPARALVAELIATAVESLAIFGKKAEPLVWLAHYVRDRGA